MCWKDEDGIYMAQVRDHWWGLVNMMIFFGFDMV